MTAGAQTTKTGPGKHAAKHKGTAKTSLQFAPPRKVQSFITAPRRRSARVTWESREWVGRTKPTAPRERPERVDRKRPQRGRVRSP
jgi:hypothetical protein